MNNSEYYPVTLLHMHSGTGSRDRDFKPQWERFPYWTFSYCLQGQGRIEFKEDKSSFLSRKDHVSIAPANCIHRGTVVSECPGIYCWLHVQFEIMGFLDPLAYLDIPNVLPAPISSKILAIAQELIQITQGRDLSMMELSVQSNYQGACLLKLLLDNFKQTAPLNVFSDEFEILMPAVDKMKRNLGKSLNIESLAQSVSMSVPTFFRRFKRAFNITPYAQLEKLRMREAVNLLCINKRSIDETSEILGYCDRFQFSKVFKRVYGKSPSQYRQNFHEESHLC